MREDGIIPREFEADFEDDFKSDFEYELEDEDFFGESEYAGEYEQEQFFGFLKNIARRILPKALRIIRGVFRESELEEDEYDFEGELAYEFEGEMDYEFEDEFAYEMEGESEYEWDGDSEFEQALADVLADTASRVSDNREAEALMAAATSKVLPAKSRTVRKLSRPLIKSATRLTRLLRKSRSSRQLMPMIPTIMRATGKTIAKQAARRKKVSSGKAAEIMASHTKKTLTSPKILAKTALRVKKAKAQARPKKRKVPLALG